jgi:hypothetical protein
MKSVDLDITDKSSPVVSKRVPAKTAVPYIVAIYGNHSAGCCLHIVLDDDNIDDQCVEWCMNQPTLCDTCRECGEILRTLSLTARRKAISLAFKQMREERIW